VHGGVQLPLLEFVAGHVGYCVLQSAGEAQDRQTPFTDRGRPLVALREVGQVGRKVGLDFTVRPHVEQPSHGKHRLRYV